MFENRWTMKKCRKYFKKNYLNFWILAVSTNFCPIKTDLSGNTVWPQASVQVFQKLAKTSIGVWRNVLGTRGKNVVGTLGVEISEFLELNFSTSNRLRTKPKTSKWRWGNSFSYFICFATFEDNFWKKYFPVVGTHRVSFFLN